MVEINYRVLAKTLIKKYGADIQVQKFVNTTNENNSVFIKFLIGRKSNDWNSYNYRISLVSKDLRASDFYQMYNVSEKPVSNIQYNKTIGIAKYLTEEITDINGTYKMDFVTHYPFLDYELFQKYYGAGLDEEECQDKYVQHNISQVRKHIESMKAEYDGTVFLTAEKLNLAASVQSDIPAGNIFNKRKSANFEAKTFEQIYRYNYRIFMNTDCANEDVTCRFEELGFVSVESKELRGNSIAYTFSQLGEYGLLKNPNIDMEQLVKEMVLVLVQRKKR